MSNLRMALPMFVLTGCAASILKMGPDTYSVADEVRGWGRGAAFARTSALQKANEHCAEMAKEILVTSVEARPVPNGGTAVVTFRCLRHGDPDLQRPNYRPTPDIVVEERRD